MKKTKIAAAFTAAIMLLTACQSGSVSKNDETEEELPTTEEAAGTENAPASGGLSGLINDIIGGNTSSDTSSSAPAETTEPNSAVKTAEADAETYETEQAPDTEPGADESGTLYKPSGNAGTIKYLGYYDITSDQKGYEQCLIFQSELYGGNIEYHSSPYGEAFYEKLSVLVAADDSPDIVEKSAMLYPGNVSKRTFEPLDEYIDLDCELWKDMKPIADSYAWNGNHYYVPHRITTSFALNYSKKTIADNGLPDPYTLYRNGEWTWEAWRDMMIKFCDKDVKNIGFYSTDAAIDALVLTTGTPLIDAQPSGRITNNLQSANVTRAMQFIEDLCRDGLGYDMQIGDWVPPDVFADNCDRLLFLCMEPEWTYIAATERIQNPTGVDNDIFDTVSEFAFVPFPRDTQADAYYQGYETFGYLIPKGARNISGAVEFINLNRVYEIDPNVQEQVKKDHIAPEKVYYTSGKYSGNEKWQITWGEQEYDLLRDMTDPSNFTFVYEDAYGFNYDFQEQINHLFNGVIERGASWTQSASEFSPVADAVISDYS